MRRLRLAPLLALAFAFGCLEREASIVDLNGIDDLRARFNADAGKPRVVLLLSPT